MFKPRYLTYLMLIAMLPLSETHAVAVPLYPVAQIAAPVYTPLTAEQLYQLVSPIALFPDKLLAQVLAGAGYPDQISSADNWLAQNRGLQPAAVLTAANRQPWDSSIRGLTLFPDVLDQMAKNIDWTTQLGYTYLNDPTDVMNAIQVMRQRADRTGTLKDTSQQRVVISAVPPDYVEQTTALQTVVAAPDEIIVIEPSQPNIMYVPYYDPWVVYGEPVRAYPGYHHQAPSGYSGGDMLATGIVSFGAGMALEALINEHHQGWNDWNVHWGQHYDGQHQPVVYNNQPYVSHSTRVTEHITNINEHITTINEYDSHASTVNRYNSPLASSPHVTPIPHFAASVPMQHPGVVSQPNPHFVQTAPSAFHRQAPMSLPSFHVTQQAGTQHPSILAGGHNPPMLPPGTHATAPTFHPAVHSMSPIAEPAAHAPTAPPHIHQNAAMPKPRVPLFHQAPAPMPVHHANVVKRPPPHFTAKTGEHQVG